MVCLLGVGLVERLWAYLEAEVFHEFENVVGTLEQEDVLVADGVVALLVVKVHQRCDLRKFVGYVLQQAIDH